MRQLLLSLSAAALGLSACFSGTDSDAARPDPYAGLSCEEKIAAIAEEVKDTRPIQVPAAKASADSSPGIQWIPPVGFDSGSPGTGTLPDTAARPETTPPTVMPASISAVQVLSRTAYKARIRIHDFRDVLVRELHQEFGYRGEFDNPHRKTPSGLLSFLVWDNKDAEGRTVPSGVYLWRARLELESGQVFEPSIKVGFIGEECRRDP